MQVDRVSTSKKCLKRFCTILVMIDLMFSLELELFLKWNNHVSKKMNQNILLIIKKEFLMK